MYIPDFLDVKRPIKSKRLKEIGLQVMSLQVAGGIAGDQSTFILTNYIKIHSFLVTGAFCYINFYELQTARNNNSIFQSINNIGTVGTVNADGTRFSLNSRDFLFFNKPLIVKEINLIQGSASPSIIMFFFENYSI